MSIDLDDPRLTAYALGELDEVNDLKTLEAAVASDPTLARYVEDIRQTAAILSHELHAEPAPAGLASEQRAAIVGPTSDQRLVSSSRPASGRSLLRRYAPHALAASLLIVAGSVALLLPYSWSAREFSAKVAATATKDGVWVNEEPTLAKRNEPFDVSRYVATDEAGAAGTTLAMNEAEVPARLSEPASVALAGKPVQASRESLNRDRVEKLASAAADERGADRNSSLESLVESRVPQDAKKELGLSYRRADVGQEVPAPPAGSMGGMAGGEMLSKKQMDGYIANGPATEAGLALDRFGVTAAEPTPAPIALDVVPSSGPVVADGLSVVTEGESLETRMRGLREEVLARQPATPAVAAPVPPTDREQYAAIHDNPFVRVAEEPLSTFSIDVDTASYANIRRYLLNQSQLPPPDAVRIEEMINYFTYSYPQPEGDDPFAVDVEVIRCPWNADHRLARIGLKGREIEGERPASNLVFLIDVSGSMNRPDKLTLLKQGLIQMLGELTENDRVGIVVYASSQGTALDPTQGDRKAEIRRVIDSLQPGGSTHGSAGIQAAYDMASANFIPGGTNRVILCTDGDFNVGITDDGSLERFITEKAASKVFLTVLGFGTGNLQDAKMEGLADKGNGNYHYIDSLKEARKVLVEELGSTLVTIAKDVKIQVDFNPAQVGAYRLIGYENRMLQAQDFRDDKKDAGEIGAGHTVTALYELVPPDKLNEKLPSAEPSKYAKPAEPTGVDNNESFTVRLRFKPPEGDVSTERQVPVVDGGLDLADASDNTRWASSVAAFGMILRSSPHRGTATLDGLLELAQPAVGDDPGGYRAEFVEMVRKAKAIQPN